MEPSKEPANIYRQNANVVPLVIWAFVCEALAILLFALGAGAEDSSFRALEIAGAAAFLVFGPVAVTIYLVRSELLWVSVEPERGIVVRGRHLVPWESIVRVEHRRLRLSVPLLEVFAPFGDRVKIVARGRSFVLRDLRGADAFLAEIRSRVQIVER